VTLAAELRPRRSVLYMPGSNERALDKARALPADALILDLEDAVAPDAKLAAREQVCRAVRGGGYGHRELAIRINGLDTPWGADDLAAASDAGPDAILVPKVDSPDVVREVERRMRAAAAPERTRIWSMIETPRAVLRAAEIATASPRQSLWVMGTNDLVKDLRCLHTPAREPLLTSLSLCVLAARAFGLAILDGVYNAIRDAEGFRAACRQALELGFDGKTLIHPDQIGPCNEVFSPDADQLEEARRIIEAFQEAAAAGRGVVEVGGRLVESLHVEQARRVVALADAIAQRSP
jgi:citrate lyase subunit beta/citryl-CoA lyase